jgi:hypothetical protein
MLALVVALGAADALVLSPPTTVVHVDNAFLHPKVAASGRGAVVTWLESAKDRTCVKAAPVDRDGKPGGTVDLVCRDGVLANNRVPIGDPVVVAGEHATLVAWSEGGTVAGGILDASLHVGHPFRLKLSDDTSIAAADWDGHRFWIVTSEAAASHLFSVDEAGKPGPVQVLQAASGVYVQRRFLHCSGGDCTVVLDALDNKNATVVIHDGQVGNVVEGEGTAAMMKLVPALGVRDLRPRRAYTYLEGFAVAETSSGTLVASATATRNHGSHLELQLARAGAGRHRATELLETEVSVAALDPDRFIVATVGKGDILVRIAQAQWARLPAEPTPAAAKLRITVTPAHRTHLGVDVVLGSAIEPVWERMIDTDENGVLELDTVAGTAWINAWEDGAMGHARFQMVDVKPGETKEVKLALGERGQVTWPGALGDGGGEVGNIRAADISGLPTFAGNNEKIFMQYVPPGKHIFVVSDEDWLMTKAIDVPPGGDKDMSKLKWSSDLEPGDIGAMLAIRGGDVVVSSIAPGSPAERAKLELGDVVIAIDGKAVLGYLDACARLYTTPGKPVALKVRSAKGRERTLSITRAGAAGR